MPIYEYKCQECGTVTEALLKSIKEKSAITCCQCGSKKVTKIFSTPGAVVMGGSKSAGTTCCGSTERCDIPPCSDGSCQRD
jgi:putative FmdB family regulatory protein